VVALSSIGILLDEVCSDSSDLPHAGINMIKSKHRAMHDLC